MEEEKTSELEDSFYFNSTINRSDSALDDTSSPYIEFTNTSIITETTTEIAISTSPITTETIVREEEKVPEIARSFTSADSSTGISYTEPTIIPTVKDITNIITEMLSSSNSISLTSTIPPFQYTEEYVLSRAIADVIFKYTKDFFALDELKFQEALEESRFKSLPNITYSFIKASIIEQIASRTGTQDINDEGIALYDDAFKEELEQSKFRYIAVKVEEILLMTLQVLAEKQFRNLDYNKVKPVVEKYIQDVWSLHLYDTNILYEGHPEASGNIAKEYRKHFTNLNLNEIQITRRFIEAINYVSENSLRPDPLIETNREPWEHYKPSIKKPRMQIYKEHFRKKAQNIFINTIKEFASHIDTQPNSWIYKHLALLRNQYTHSDLLPTPGDIMYRKMPDKEIITQRARLAEWLSTVTEAEFSSYFPESYRGEALKEKTRLKPVFEVFVRQSTEFLGASIMIVFKEVRQSSILSTNRNNSDSLERNEQLLNKLPNNNIDTDNISRSEYEKSSYEPMVIHEEVSNAKNNNGTFASLEGEDEDLEEQEDRSNSTNTEGFYTNNRTITLPDAENQDNDNVTQFINPEEYEERNSNSTEVYKPPLDRNIAFDFTLENMFNYVIATFLLKKLPGFSEEKTEAFKGAVARSDFKALPNIVYEFIRESIIEAVLAKCPPSARKIYYESKNFKDLTEKEASIFEAELEKSEFKYIPLKIEKALRDLKIILKQGPQSSMDKLLEDFITSVWSLHLFEVSEIYSGWPQRSCSIATEYKKYFSDLNEIQLLYRFVEALAYVKENFPQMDRPEELSCQIEESSSNTMAKKSSRIEFYICNFYLRAAFLFKQENIAFSALKDVSSDTLITEYLVFLRTRLYPLTADGQISVVTRKYIETSDIELITSSNKLATWLATTPDEEFGRYFLESDRAQVLAQRKELKDIYQRYINISSLALADHHNKLSSKINSSSKNEDEAKTSVTVTLSSLLTGSSIEIEGKPRRKLARRERREAPFSYSTENSFKAKLKKPGNDNNIDTPNSASTHAGFINSFFSSLIGLAGYIVSTRLPEAQPFNNWPNIAAETSRSHEQETTAELNINPEFPDATSNLTLITWAVGKIFGWKLPHFTNKGELSLDQKQGIKDIINLKLLAAVEKNCLASDIEVDYLNIRGIEELSNRISSDILNGRQPNISNFSAKDLLINWRSKDPRNLQITKVIDKTKTSLADITSDCSLDSIFRAAGVPLLEANMLSSQQMETIGHSFLGLSSLSPSGLLSNVSLESIANNSVRR